MTARSVRQQSAAGRRWIVLLLCLILLATGASASGRITQAEVLGQVSDRGNCAMTLQLRLNLSEQEESLTIPLGEGASGVSVSGASARVRKIGGIPSVVLKSDAGFIGEQQITLIYTLKDCTDSRGTLTVPILAPGLAYPVSGLRFTLTLPGSFNATPAFTSSYYGTDVDNYMTVTVENGTVSGTLNVELRDREALTMTLKAPELFQVSDQASAHSRLFLLFMAVLALMAAAYWGIRLRWTPGRIHASAQIPLDVSAGEISCLLGGPMDLGLTVLSWARLGYLVLHLDPDGNLTLHKRMEMGNERSAYEGSAFRALFGRGQLVEAGSRHFQELRQKLAAGKPPARGLYTKTSGNPRLVRILAAASAFCGGLALGSLYAPGGALRILLPLLAGGSCAAGSLLLQSAPRALLSCQRRPGLWGLVGMLLILLPGLQAGSLALAAVICLSSLLLGALVLFGGQRSAGGAYAVQAVLGLLRYLCRTPSKQLRQAQHQNPALYYELAPYALALGVDRRFARRFGNLRLSSCSWLLTDTPQGGTPETWYPLLRRTLTVLDGGASGSRLTAALSRLR